MDKKEALDALKIDRDEREPRGGGRIAAIVTALVILIGGGAAAWAFLAPRAVAVTTAMAKVSGGSSAGAGGSVLNASGYVVAQLQTTVSSQITGQIEKVLVEEGMRVAKGQVLARLDDSSERAMVATAESQLQADRANVAKAHAQLAQDKLTLKRTRTLADQHLVSAADLDQAQSQVKIDEATLAEAEGMVKVDESNLKAARISLGYTIIRAPFAGVVTEKYAHPGEMISPAAVGGFTKTGVCQLVDMKSLEVDVDVNEAYIQRVHDGMRAEAVLDAYPNWRIPSHVISVVPTANRQKATVKVRISFDELDPRIVPEMGVQVWFYEKARPAGKQAPAVVSVPKAAIRGGGAAQYVFLVDNSRAKRTPVTTGPVHGRAINVISGLAGGERVIVSAPKSLQDGDKVEVEKM